MPAKVIEFRDPRRPYQPPAHTRAQAPAASVPVDLPPINITFAGDVYTLHMTASIRRSVLDADAPKHTEA